MRQARVRTESMAQRLAKKPIAEGFELWDSGFPLGAMRLFIFKAESSPPFQLGPCLDAVANLLFSMEEFDDAAENYTFAADKYQLIQQPILAEIMNIKGKEAKEGPEAALPLIDALIKENDEGHAAKDVGDIKKRSGLARAYFTRAEIKHNLGTKGDAPNDDVLNAAVDDVKYAHEVGWDRQHMALQLLGKIYTDLGEVDKAIEAFNSAAAANTKYFHPRVSLYHLYRGEDRPTEAIEAATNAIAVHPRSALIRDKAFLLAETPEAGGVDAAIKLLDENLATPPVEEAEGVSFKGSTEATLYKAKAAILADEQRLPEALEAAEAAMKVLPDDEESISMSEDIKASIEAGSTDAAAATPTKDDEKKE